MRSSMLQRTKTLVENVPQSSRVSWFPRCNCWPRERVTILAVDLGDSVMIDTCGLTSSCRHVGQEKQCKSDQRASNLCEFHHILDVNPLCCKKENFETNQKIKRSQFFQKKKKTTINQKRNKTKKNKRRRGASKEYLPRRLKICLKIVTRNRAAIVFFFKKKDL